jgi:hypothetical protein
VLKEKIIIPLVKLSFLLHRTVCFVSRILVSAIAKISQIYDL